MSEAAGSLDLRKLCEDMEANDGVVVFSSSAPPGFKCDEEDDADAEYATLTNSPERDNRRRASRVTMVWALMVRGAGVLLLGVGFGY